MAQKTNVKYSETVAMKSSNIEGSLIIVAKDISSSTKIGQLLENEGNDVNVTVKAWVLIKVVNENSKDKEYEVLNLLTDKGKLSTSSNAFISKFSSIIEDLTTFNEDDYGFDLTLSTRPSKHYEKGFLSCALAYTV